MIKDGRRRAVLGAIAGLVMALTPSVAGARPAAAAPATLALLSSTVTITAPATANLGSAPTGAGTLSAHLGTVTVSASGVLGLLLPSFTATASSTNFTTGGGTAAETVPNGSISYWSGPVTASTGSQTAVPGQLTATQAVPMSASLTAFASSGLVTSISTSWSPTIVVHVPAAVVAGTYTGTITHSAA